MKKRTLIIGAIILVIILGVIILTRSNQDTFRLCVIDPDKPIAKIGTCNSNEDCPSYANVCEMEAKQCTIMAYITEKEISYMPGLSKSECKIMGGSWKLINKNQINPR